MSPIGKTFLVLNLVLAGGFVYFSGVYLQRATDWKQKHDALKTSSDTRVQQLTDQITATENDKRAAERQRDAAEQAKNTLDVELQAAKAENQNLAKQLNTIQGELATQAANYSTISSSIDTATKEFAESSKSAIAAGLARDEAVRAMEIAKADLRDEQDKNAALASTLEERDATIAQRDETIKEQGVLIDIARTRYPGLFASAQPDLSGTVHQVDVEGKLVTILITADPTDSGCKKGYSFAIYDGGTYKGEAIVQSVSDKFAFCRVTRTTGVAIKEGDQASTLLGPK